MFKFELGQIVYYLLTNKICSAEILTRMRCENLRDKKTFTEEQKKLFAKWGESGTYYVTCHGVFSENYLGASPQEVAQKLLEPFVDNEE
jgi:hypothetical protein